jgi:hypothetical protein
LKENPCNKKIPWRVVFENTLKKQYYDWLSQCGKQIALSKSATPIFLLAVKRVWRGAKFRKTTIEATLPERRET